MKRNQLTRRTARRPLPGPPGAHQAQPLTQAASRLGLRRKYLREKADLQRRLAAAEAKLKFYESKHEWLESALSAQRHARQLLEASVAAGYGGTITRIRDVVRSVVPAQASLLVVSKGDPELLQFDNRRAAHFPQNRDGQYAGFYPADSAAAIAGLKALLAKGAEFLLLPNTAFWWLEHYRQFGEWLDKAHRLVWRDERCVIYKLSPERSKAAPGPRLPKHKPADFSPTNTGARAVEPKSRDVLRAAANGRGANILCFPIINWDFRFQRPQQLMRRFAAEAHRVFYLSHQFLNSGKAYSLRPLAPSLWEVALRGPRYHTYQGVLDEGHRERLFASLRELRRAHRLDAGVVVVQSPFWWPLAKEAARRFGWRVVYDCLDFHAGFSGSNPILIEQERELLAQAQLVIASSEALKVHALQYAPKVLLLRNGCDYKHFAGICPPPKRTRPVIGYYGAIADWFDTELMADLAQRRPDWDFILVGSTFSADVRRLSKLKNVSLPGEKPYAEIPQWVSQFDVALLPFKRTPLTDAANPVKAYEILAGGKPLVSVPLPEMVRLKPLVRLASTVEEFEREIQAELNPADPGQERKRRAFARNNTWEKRYRQLATALAGLLNKPHRRTSAAGEEIPACFV